MIVSGKNSPTSTSLNKSPVSPSNAVTNAGFEAGDFTRWMVSNHPIIADHSGGGRAVHDGLHSPVNNQCNDSFYQSLNFPILRYGVFGFAMPSAVSLSDANWHEIRLMVTGSELWTTYLHYVMQSAQLADTATDNYFLVYNRYAGRWVEGSRPLINDLVEKIISQYLGATVTNITCEQGGNCATACDSLLLAEFDPLSDPRPNAIMNDGFEFENFTGWTQVGQYPYVTIIDYNANQISE